MAIHIIFYLSAIFLFQACQVPPPTQINSKPLAKVGQRFLYQKDITGLGIGKGMSTDDSLNQLKMHVNKWLRDELMLQVAEDNIEISEDVEKMVRDFKATLVMNQYEEVLISQRLNTEVTPQQLAEYYSKNQEQYILKLLDDTKDIVFGIGPAGTPGRRRADRRDRASRGASASPARRARGPRRCRGWRARWLPAR